MTFHDQQMSTIRNIYTNRENKFNETKPSGLLIRTEGEWRGRCFALLEV